MAAFTSSPSTRQLAAAVAARRLRLRGSRRRGWRGWRASRHTSFDCFAFGRANAIAGLVANITRNRPLLILAHRPAATRLVAVYLDAEPHRAAGQRLRLFLSSPSGCAVRIASALGRRAPLAAVIGCLAAAWRTFERVAANDICHRCRRPDHHRDETSQGGHEAPAHD